ncbi:DUF4126 domain-containing protein [Thermodesulforhabdus norvegica]|uniref:DUF4126 domain-containing protein n=1 Tax=Thermodesulforhabdus norvegica TaxID=39841 RepID=A0A1I4QUR7_9BACT|nr:DUF4126 domain-containing protein [Thermodesulforhabdus norvegica]SFM43747.1 protein of unknown function [Thermodesulforhabdus norvegica]
MEAIALLGRLLGLSFVSGINLYATIAVVGLAVKFKAVSNVPPELYVLANDGVIGLALVLYFLEFVADKIPGLDTMWDLLHTFIRPFGGALLAFLSVANGSPVAEVVAFMLGMFIAGLAHATKAGTRMVLQISPEPVSNVVASVGEDVIAVSMAYIAMKHPFLSFFIVLAIGVVLWFVLPVLFNAVSMMLRGLWWRISGRYSSLEDFSDLPEKWKTVWSKVRESEERVKWCGPAFVRSVPSTRRFSSGWLVITEAGVYFCLRRMGRKRVIFRRGTGFVWICRPGRLFYLCRIYFDTGEEWEFFINAASEKFFRAKLFELEKKA